jgi:hypothetical protein
MQRRHGMDAAFAAAGVTVAPQVETDSMTVLYAHLRRAGLYSILPHSVLCMTNSAGQLCSRPMSPQLQRDIGLVLLAPCSRTGRCWTPRCAAFAISTCKAASTVSCRPDRGFYFPARRRIAHRNSRLTLGRHVGGPEGLRDDDLGVVQFAVEHAVFAVLARGHHELVAVRFQVLAKAQFVRDAAQQGAGLEVDASGSGERLPVG